MSDAKQDAEHSPASVVGAPPYALPLEDGGEAAVVGHPNPPSTLADSPVRGDTDGLEAPWKAKGGAKSNAEPVADDSTEKEAPAKTTAKKRAAKRTASRS